MIDMLIVRVFLIVICVVGASACSSTNKDLAEALAYKLQNEGTKLVATGYADINAQGGNESQRRVLAIRASKIDAYRSLSEQIYGLYIDSSTTVGDLVVQSDIIQTRVEGIIYGAEIESIKPISDSTYEVTLSLTSNVAENLKKLYLSSID